MSSQVPAPMPTLYHRGGAQNSPSISHPVRIGRLAG